MNYKRVVVIGLDGLDPVIVETMIAAGELPNLTALRKKGGYARLATTLPAQTPVAWSSFAVGANPGAHGIFDFLRRDPATYLPEVALYSHEQKSRFLPPKAVNLRGGRAVWTRLSEAGIPSVVLRHPCTYPPAPFKGRLLAGVGVPDLRGGFGSATYYSSEPSIQAGESERVFLVQLDDRGRTRIELPGPLLPNGEELRLGLDLEVDESGPGAQISCPDQSFSHPVSQGKWTDWVSVRFKLGRLQTIRGILRFFLLDTKPLRLFASPVQFDPDVPLFPISHPWDYAGELKRAVGPFATLGMAEEHNGVTNGRIDEAAFMDHCLDVLQERRAMMHYELARHHEGLFYCLFDTPDRIQHIFWRFREPEHPANLGEPPPSEWCRVIEDYYRRCDQIVGEALAHVDTSTLMIVASDHGFTTFQRKIHLNAWLHRHGYLTLKSGVQPGESSGSLPRNVDWGRTKAYAVGLAGLYLNVRGREAEGIVRPSEAPALRQEIAGRLRGMEDRDRGAVAVRNAFPRERVYSGPFADDAPDVVLACAPGYRISSPSAMGGIGPEVLSDNTRRWSGDHAVDPSAVPGILFMNSAFRTQGPGIMDLAPTILEALGVPGDEELEGASLIS